MAQRFDEVAAVDRATRSYLAARLFGNWLTYYAGGLATVVEFLRVGHAVLRVEMARRHLQPPQKFGANRRPRDRT